MDFQSLFNGALTLIWAIGGFLVHRMFKKLDDLEIQDEKLTKQINEIRVSLPTNFVTKDDLREAIKSLETHLTRIEDKVDNTLINNKR